MLQVGGGRTMSPLCDCAIASAGVIQTLCVVSVSSCAGVWCGGTRVMKKRVSNWRVSIGGVTQCANSTSVSSARRSRSRSMTARSVVVAAVDGRCDPA